MAASQPAPPASNDMLSGLALENAILQNAIKKICNPLDKTFFLGVLAGVWVGFGGMAALSVAGGIPADVRSAWPFLPKLGVGLFFPFALHFILLFGGELFTGNMMILPVGFYNGVVPWHRVLLNWLTVYIANWCGCLLTGYFLAYRTELFTEEPYLSYLQSYTLSKLTAHGWGVIFLKAIPANALVCMAVVLGMAARDSAGKIMALLFPVVLFVVSGFEHCVANMFFTSLGLMYGTPTTVGRLWFNQSAAVLGNFVGAAFLIAGSMHAMNHWVSIFSFLPERYRGPVLGGLGTESGTFAAHDVESTRRARDFTSHAEADEHRLELKRHISMSISQARERNVRRDPERLKRGSTF